MESPALTAMLARANGRRSTRLLSSAELEACARDASTSPLGFSWRTGGVPPDARALTTICLAVVRDGRLTIGVSSAHGAATPASAWADLREWDRYDEAVNAEFAQAWAGRERDDRVRLPLVVAKPERATRDELLARILEAPFDDAPRLVLGDLLSEQGDPRGELIHLQFAGEHDRAAELLETHGALWLGELTPEFARVEFSRGFASRVELLDARALPQLSAFAEHEPLVELEVTSDRLFDAARFATLAWSRRLGSLGFSRGTGYGALSVDQLERLLTSRHLRRLERLALRGQRLGDDGVKVLLELGPSCFPSLTHLAIERDGLTSASARLMASSRWLAALDTLALDDNALGPEGAVALATSRLEGRHRSLSLAGNQLGNEGAVALARSRRLRLLRRLSLARNRVSATGLDALLGSAPLKALEALDLDGNPIGASGRERLRARFGAPVRD